MKLTDEDDFDSYLDDEELEPKKPGLFERKTADEESEELPKRPPVQSKVHNTSEKKERFKSVERTSNGKVVPIRTTSKGFEVCIIKPTSFEDSQVICDMLLTGRATIINLEGFDDKLAQRTMDFVSGSVYAINGRLHRISSCIFIVSPDTVDISGDYLDMIREDGFEPPTFNTKF